MKKIIVLGSLNMDLVTTVKRTPIVGETVIGSGLIQVAGGKGANQAATIGRLGGSVSMLGKVGRDAFGEYLIDCLSIDGVEIDKIMISENNPTGTALIMVNEDGDNSIVVIPGANYDLVPEDIDVSMLGGNYIVAQLETPLGSIEKSFKLARENGVTTVLNPAPAAALPESILQNTDLLIPNESEFKLLTGYDPNDEEMLRCGVSDLLAKGVKTVIVTLGSKGAVLCEKDTTKYFTAQKVNAIDTTAAGDSFIGGLMYSLSNDKSMDEAIEFASQVAAITVTRAGAQSSLPTLDEVYERFGDVNA